jgi:hypothetical protein
MTPAPIEEVALEPVTSPKYPSISGDVAAVLHGKGQACEGGMRIMTPYIWRTPLSAGGVLRPLGPSG